MALLASRTPPPLPPLLCAAGMRSLGLALIACCHVLPPLPALLLQAGHTALTWNPGYCSTLLLAAPLAQQRQAALARVLELGSLPLAAVQPIALQLPAALSGASGWSSSLVCLWCWQRLPGSQAAGADGLACRSACCPLQTRMRSAWPPRRGCTSPPASLHPCFSLCGCGPRPRRCATPPACRSARASGPAAPQRHVTGKCTGRWGVRRGRWRAPPLPTSLQPIAGCCSVHEHPSPLVNELGRALSPHLAAGLVPGCRRFYQRPRRCTCTPARTPCIHLFECSDHAAHLSSDP